MSQRTKNIVKKAIELAESNNGNWNEDGNNIVTLNNYQVVENVNIEIIDYASTVSEEIGLPYCVLKQYDVMEPEMLEPMDIEATNEELPSETQCTSMNDISEKTNIEEENKHRKEEANGTQETSKHEINEATYTAEINKSKETGRYKTDGSMSSHDISDDSDYITPKLVPYSGSDSSSDEMPTKSKKRRKRFQVEKTSWFSEKNKNRREKGKRYFGRTKINGKWSYDIERKPRKLKERCQCRAKNGVLKCSQITEQQREVIFKYFWDLSWGEKKVFVDSTVKSDFIKRARDRKVPEQSRRNQTFKYYLKTGDQEIRVCKTMYLNTVGLGRWSIQNWKDTFSNFEKADDDEKKLKKRPSLYRKEKGNKKKPFEIENQSIHEFLDSLPTMEAHYCRASSTKNYLLSEWTSKEELYRFYKKEWCGPKNIQPLSGTTFKKAFESKNMALFRPKKDECEICNKFKEGYISEEDYSLHTSRKMEARKELEKDKENEKFLYTVDVQAVLLSPKSNISSLYYKTKLCVHNLCYFDLNNKDGFCYLWHEGEGGLNAEEFSSCFHFFIENQVIPFIGEEKRKVVFWSDGCTYQNRNSLLANVAVNLAKQYKITIEHKYLEVGHTQMPVDSMHSTIERRLKKRRINVPAEYAFHCKRARLKPRPYNVKYLDHNFFKSFEDIQTVKSIRPGKKAGDPKVIFIHHFIIFKVPFALFLIILKLNPLIVFFLNFR